MNSWPRWDDGCGLACQNDLNIFIDDSDPKRDKDIQRLERAHKAASRRVSLVTSTQREPTKNKMRWMSFSMGSFFWMGLAKIGILGNDGFVAWPNQLLK